jgi:hypothetical protein
MQRMFGCYLQFFSHNLVVLEVLEGASLRSEFLKAPRGQPTDITLILYRGPSAPYCNITWQFGDPAVLSQFTNRLGKISCSRY